MLNTKATFIPWTQRWRSQWPHFGMRRSVLP